MDEASRARVRASDASTHVVPRVYLTADVPGVGGHIKSRATDFLVEEQPLYAPAGEGEHLYLFIEKRAMTTLDLVDLLARHFRVSRTAIGYAGLKDKQAVTRQVMSVHLPGKREEDYPQIADQRVGVLWMDRHLNKLRVGHLKGNRFSIKVRGVPATHVQRALKVLARLERTGVPNRIGEQRFGFLENNHLIGRAILRRDAQAVLDLLLGPDEAHADDQRPAREAYARGDFAEAFACMPRQLKTERNVLHALTRGVGVERAQRAMGRTVAEYYLTAFQSAVFNTVLDRRLELGAFDRLLEGDVAQKHDNLACFDVDAGVLGEAGTGERLGAFEISPSGPMWGAGMKEASGVPGEIERAALAEAGFTPADLAAFDASEGISCAGARRPLRVPLKDPDVEGGVDEFGAYVRCAFELPRGAFATVVMREVMKGGEGDGTDAGTPEDGSERGT